MFNVFLAAISVVTNSIMAFVLFKNNSRSASNLLLVALAAIIVLWTIFTHLAMIPGDPGQQLFFVRAVMFFTVIFGPVVFLLSKEFPNTTINMSKKSWFYFIAVILAGLLTSPFTFSELVITSPTSFSLVPDFGIIFYALNFMGFMALGFIILLRRYRKSYGIIKVQLGLFLLGLVITCVLLTLTNFLLVVLYGSVDFVRYGPAATLILLGFLTYAIVKHRLLDIRFLLVRSLGYSLTFVSVITIYVSLLTLIQTQIVDRAVSALEITLSVLITVIIAFSFNPVRNIFAKLTNKFFYKDSYDSEKLLYRLTSIMASSLVLEELNHKLLRELITVMHISYGAFILVEEDKIYLVSTEGNVSLPELDEKEMKHIFNGHESITVEELPEGKTKHILQKYSFFYIAALNKEGKRIGFLALGEKLSGDSYTSADLTLLSIFIRSAAVAIENAKAYEEIRRFNITLEEEIERATKRLVSANHKLQQLDKLKDEFVSIASHELRTPMVSIKNYIWMTLAGKGGKLTKKQAFYLNRSYDSANRMTKLINDMLNISRIESGRILLHVAEVDIKDLVVQIIDENKPRAKELKVDLELTDKVTHRRSKKAAELPTVLADRDKVAEVLVNLVGNALKFTPAGGKAIISFQVEDEYVYINVTDSGVGLENDQISKLFKKFGMVKDSYRSHADAAQGTGLGLYVSKSIIELHEGSIWVTSDGRDSGSTFTFTLKPYTEKDADRLNKKFTQEADTRSIPKVQGEPANSDKKSIVATAT